MPLTSVLAAARKEVGYKEGANNDNKFAAIAGHANHQPWCATFIRACFIKGEEEKAIPDSAYCPHIEAWGRGHNRVVPVREAKRGDLVLFDFSRTGKAEHVGILDYDYDPTKPNLIRTIEGNTGAISASEGDGVQKKKRHVSLVRIIIRPKWSNE